MPLITVPITSLASACLCLSMAGALGLPSSAPWPPDESRSSTSLRATGRARG
jgi:hypothetical protein